jgi:hypothetical protein
VTTTAGAHARRPPPHRPTAPPTHRPLAHTPTRRNAYDAHAYAYAYACLPVHTLTVGACGVAVRTDLDWLRYLSGTRAEVSAARGNKFGRVGDEGDEGGLAERSVQEGLRKRAIDEGLDAAHRGQLDAFAAQQTGVSALGYFAALESSSKAGLTRAHVLALRLYTCPTWHARINKALHDGCDANHKHPLPMLVSALVEAFWKLRHTQAQRRTDAVSTVEVTGEALRAARAGDDEEAMETALSAYEAALYARSALVFEQFWAGLPGLDLGTLKQRGAAELGFSTMSSNREVAQAAAREHIYAERRKQRFDEDQQEKLVAIPVPVDAPVVHERRGSTAANTAAAAAAYVQMMDNANAAPAAAERRLSRRSSRESKEKMANGEEAAPAPLLEAASAKLVASEGEDRAAAKNAELSVRLMRVMVPNEEGMPVDLSEYAVLSESEWFYPPGAIFECKKDSPDTIGADEETENEIRCKAVEVAPRILRPAGLKAPRAASMS